MANINSYDDLLLLNVSGLTQGKKPGTFVLLLVEANGQRRMPVTIGPAEAQSIATCLQNIKPIRPFSHDLFFALGASLQIMVEAVVITKLQDGIFYSRIDCRQGDRVVHLDSRTSDAVAIALRFGAPIFASEQIVHEVASQVTIVFPDGKILPPDIPIEQMTPDQLSAAMNNAIADENYELAAKIRDLLNNR